MEVVGGEDGCSIVAWEEVEEGVLDEKKREPGERRGDEDEGGVVGRPAAERKGLLLRPDCSLSGAGGAAHSHRIWPMPV